MHTCTTSHKFFLKIILRKPDGTMDITIVIFYWFATISNFLNPRASERRRGIGTERAGNRGGRQKEGGIERNEMTKRRWNANLLRSRVSCHLSPLASGSLNFMSRYTSLTWSIVRSQIMQRYYQQFHLFFFLAIMSTTRFSWCIVRGTWERNYYSVHVRDMQVAGGKYSILLLSLSVKNIANYFLLSKRWNLKIAK